MIPRAYRTARPEAANDFPRDASAIHRARIQARVDALLPAYYQGAAEVSPISMGSATLVRDDQGQIAWDRIWTSFCDLALAGGPPHRGSLLRPVGPSALATAQQATRAVETELTRAIHLVTGWPTAAATEPGWLAVKCESIAAANWLTLAVVAENVSCRRRGETLEVPIGPDFRPEKEIKNVVCALAKAKHYWEGHLAFAQQATAALLDVGPAGEPAQPADTEAHPAAVADAQAQLIAELLAAGLPGTDQPTLGWVGLKCASDQMAGQRVRVVASSGVMCRREGAILYVPSGSHVDLTQCHRVVASCRDAWELLAPAE